MRQVLQDLKSGKTLVEDVPVPAISSNEILIDTELTLISVGTEKMLVDFGKANLLQKARQQPDKVRMVIDKVKTDGLFSTVESVQAKLDAPLPLGYCNVGVVLSVGKNVTDLRPGDRVVSNGHHADFVVVPENLCCKIPDNVTSEQAVFTVQGAIALQGVRLVAPSIGETIVVIGLGLIGLLAVQILRANGCQVIAIDFDADRAALAEEFGAVVLIAGRDDIVNKVHQLTQGVGCDAVVVTANTASSEPISDAANMSRQRGRIVLVGVTGLELSRADFYEKELSFQVSCSYGPGRYDPLYEQQGQDYPIGFVRWTEQRNFAAVLQLISDEKVDVCQLISDRYPIADAANAYRKISEGQKSIGVLLEFPNKPVTHEVKQIIRPTSNSEFGRQNEKAGMSVKLGFIGSGNYAAQVLVPAFAKTNSVLMSVSCQSGVSGTQLSKKYDIPIVTTENQDILSGETCNTVVISTRHDSHAELALFALRSGKNVFLEKPLCIYREQLGDFKQFFSSAPSSMSNASSRQPIQPSLMLGFNRRFSPLVRVIKNALAEESAPKVMHYNINAGVIDKDHWTQDRAIGGGRIIGELCHFVDLCRYIGGSAISDVFTMSAENNITAFDPKDNISVNLAFTNGSIATIHYFSNGHRGIPKERFEVSCAGQHFVLDNFKKLTAKGRANKNRILFRQDKGQRNCADAFVESIIRGSNTPIPLAELFEVTETCFDIEDQILDRRN